ncbi:1-pyrroline-5-carboxylate dehydrogenase [Marinomonas sp. C2222]|uniref:1-pyrroline-5-carboxylate dehydrogenase n=1 Tax=Marinomonas sargassi TaxID=2984494 RepID=A0ABT2YQY1_9GAMM|nr:1-pyrroline-5-carboxylate dehydrogenase [Marinomonas sargassi]MCV2402059.1 1-pyrroline-5-carboxylate dehydrogenase [Marinomonas sargassi]
MTTTHTNQIQVALNAFERWDRLGVTGRCDALRKTLPLLAEEQQKMAEWQLNNAQEKIADKQIMPGPTGERNELFSQGRGPFLCLNDLAGEHVSTALVGQVYTALVAGNPIITSGLEGKRLIDILQPLLPEGVVQNISDVVLDALLEADSLAGVAILCDMKKAKSLNSRLAAKEGLLCQLVAETSDTLARIAKPNYILNFITEKTVSINTTAIGGNATLLELGSKAD